MSEKSKKILPMCLPPNLRPLHEMQPLPRKLRRKAITRYRLFRAISEAESVHDRRYLLLMRGKIGSTEENLETAFQNEIKANVKEYPKLIKDASDEKKEGVLKAFSQSRDVENGHSDLYKKTMKDKLTDRDTKYCVCQVCGYVSEKEAQDSCPVCGAVKGKFLPVV